MKSKCKDCVWRVEMVLAQGVPYRDDEEGYKKNFCRMLPQVKDLRFVMECPLYLDPTQLGAETKPSGKTVEQLLDNPMKLDMSRGVGPINDSVEE